MRRLESYIRKYGPEFGPVLYHALQSQAAHAGVSARLRRKIDVLTGKAPAPAPASRKREADALPLFDHDAAQLDPGSDGDRDSHSHSHDIASTDSTATVEPGATDGAEPVTADMELLTVGA